MKIHKMCTMHPLSRRSIVVATHASPGCHNQLEINAMHNGRRMRRPYNK